MAQKDSPNKIGLAKLRGKPSNQSVPSISFRFNTTSENITEVVEVEDDSLSKQDSLSGTPTDASTLDNQQLNSGFKLLSQRSVSLDSNQGAADIPSPKANESPSLLSRITKSFEHKISEIRSEKQKEPKGVKESKIIAKIDFADESKYVDDKGKIDKPKTSLVQDLSEQTNKLKLEFRDSIRPKLTELRNRKASGKDTNKTKSSLLTTLLGREALTPDEVARDDCEQAVEAKEEIVESVPEVDLVPVEELVNFGGVTEEPAPNPDANESKPVYESLLNISHSFFYKIVFVLFIFFAIFPLNVMLGFFIGIILGGIACFYYLMNVPQHITYKPQDKESCNLQIRVFEEHTPFEGWMNELSDAYSPDTYHVSQTHSVYVRLQGSVLKIDHPKRKVSKHARSNEELDCRSFVNHREYDLKDCEVLLLPVNLPRRWLWSRKYPIFIQLKKKDNICDNTAANSTAVTPQEHKDQDFAETQDEFLKNESMCEDDLTMFAVELDTYEEVTADMCQEKSLNLFARSDREKDDWFRRFVVASQKDASRTINEDSKTSGRETSDSTPSEEQTPTEECRKDESQQLDFALYMALLQQNNRAAANIGWFNSLVGRIFFDFLHSQYWANKIQERIQRKLSKLHLPYFVGEIIVCGVDLGTTIPILLSTERPSVNERGVWVDLAMSYNGSLTLSLETKLDLMKLKERSGAVVSANPPSPTEGSRTNNSPSNECVLHNISYDTDTDDSIESSSEEETEEEAALESSFRGSSGPASKRLMRIVDTVTTSRYFQQASEWRVLQRAMMGVSNTRIELRVEVKRLEGILTVNIPPPPSDRLWYGFRKMPDLDMVAKPCLGQRTINLPFLTDYIEKELRNLFEKVFILPNMDDLVIPVMSPLLPGQAPPPRPWESQRSSPPKSPNKESKSNVASDT